MFDAVFRSLPKPPSKSALRKKEQRQRETHGFFPIPVGRMESGAFDKFVGVLRQQNAAHNRSARLCSKRTLNPKKLRRAARRIIAQRTASAA